MLLRSVTNLVSTLFVNVTGTSGEGLCEGLAWLSNNIANKSYFGNLLFAMWKSRMLLSSVCGFLTMLLSQEFFRHCITHFHKSPKICNENITNEGMSPSHGDKH